MPLGISGLNPPSRYMADIYVKANSEYIEIDLNKLKEIENTDPEYASFLFLSCFSINEFNMVFKKFKRLSFTRKYQII